MEKQAAEQAKAAGTAGDVTTTAGEMAAPPASPLTAQPGSHMTVQQAMDKNKESEY